MACVVCLDTEGTFKTICLNGHSVHPNCLIRLRVSHERAKHPQSDDDSPANCPTCRTPTFDVGKEPTDLSRKKTLLLLKSSEEAVLKWQAQVEDLNAALRARDEALSQLARKRLASDLAFDRRLAEQERELFGSSDDEPTYSPTSPSYSPTSP